MPRAPGRRSNPVDARRRPCRGPQRDERGARRAAGRAVHRSRHPSQTTVRGHLTAASAAVSEAGPPCCWRGSPTRSRRSTPRPRRVR
jgi:hypothetical protein